MTLQQIRKTPKVSVTPIGCITPEQRKKSKKHSFIAPGKAI